MIEEHRAVMVRLAQEGCYYPLDLRGMPIVERDGKRKRLEVHHFDGDRSNNCLCNLIWMEKVIHLRIPRGGLERDPETGRFMSWGSWAEKYGEEV